MIYDFKIYDKENEIEHEYEVDSQKNRNAISDILISKFASRMTLSEKISIVEFFSKILFEYDLENDFTEWLDEELKDYFREDAERDYKENYK